MLSTLLYISGHIISYTLTYRRRDSISDVHTPILCVVSMHGDALLQTRLVVPHYTEDFPYPCELSSHLMLTIVNIGDLPHDVL